MIMDPLHSHGLGRAPEQESPTAVEQLAIELHQMNEALSLVTAVTEEDQLAGSFI